MSEYRILEKTGLKFVVQQVDDYPDQMDFYAMLKDPNCHKDGYRWRRIVDLKELGSLQKAKEYKHELQLEEGIIRE